MKGCSLRALGCCRAPFRMWMARIPELPCECQAARQAMDIFLGCESRGLGFRLLCGGLRLRLESSKCYSNSSACSHEAFGPQTSNTCEDKWLEFVRDRRRHGNTTASPSSCSHEISAAPLPQPHAVGCLSLGTQTTSRRRGCSLRYEDGLRMLRIA